MDRAGIVIVSHSQKLALGLEELLRQLAPSVPIRIPLKSDEVLGTSAESIRSAILEIPSTHDVIVLFDLGSSLMNAEMAVELLDRETQSRVHIVDAPLVEGAVAAAVALHSGLSSNMAIQEAEQARVLSKMAR